MITVSDAVTILERNGFTVPDYFIDRWVEITYNGERVGTLYLEEIYIASEFPHLRDNSYEDTKKQGAVRLYSRTARSDLEYCIQVLLKSPADFEEKIRDERAKQVRAYFNRRKNAVNEIEQFMLAEMC